MADNQEQIESRLCGYVDETLDPAEKAEIEAHLLTNPQHRQLLSELRKMSDALRALPRESAPAELSESFTGQLERSVLLDGIGQPAAEPRMRIAHFSRLAAIAAIALLAVGPGIVIYIARPPSKNSIAQNTHTPVTPPNIDGGEEIAKAPSAPLPSAAGPERQAQIDQASPPAGPAVPNAGVIANSASAERNGNISANPQLAAVAQSALTNSSVRALLGETDRALPSGRPTLVMIVASTDLNSTARKLGGYLETSNADWQSATALDAEPKAGQPPFGNGKFQAVGGSLGAATAPLAPAGKEQQKGFPTTMPQTQPDAFASAANNGPTTGPFGVAQQSQMASNAGQDKLELDEKSSKDLKNQLVGNDDRLYVVRNLSFEQAVKLSDMLHQGSAQAAAPLFADKAQDGVFDATKIRESGQELQQAPSAPRDRLSANSTQPSTVPQAADLTKDEGQRMDMAATTQPQTNPAGVVYRAIAPIDNQALLGSSPVDLVIVIQNAPVGAAALPTTNPTTTPAPAPTTAPATQP